MSWEPITASEIADLRTMWGSPLHPSTVTRYATPELEAAADAWCAAAQRLKEADDALMDLAKAEGWPHGA